MGATMIEKILGNHAGRRVSPGEIVDINIDARVARDFGGASVVGHLQVGTLPIADPTKTFFTFDCNPGGSDQRYASNQQACRSFARENEIRVFDIDAGIGTHLAIDEGLAHPGSTFVSTDSHANILGAIGAFGQGMGHVDVAHAFARGTIWFKVPPTLRVRLAGRPSQAASAKDIVLAMLRQLGAAGLLGRAAEITGDLVDEFGVASRITIASMATEMGGIIALFAPNEAVLAHSRRATGREVEPVLADDDATYAGEITVDIDGLAPLAARPGHPNDVVEVASLAGTKIDSAFIGSCTNGRIEDLRAAAEILDGRRVAPGVVLKVVPATDRVWREALAEGLIATFKRAGALVGNAGCAGCAAGQIGQNGPGEVTVSTGNRNFTGKQGKGHVYLASPAVVAASAVAGAIALPDHIPDQPAVFELRRPKEPSHAALGPAAGGAKPTTLTGRAWVIREDNIDTDMIFHNRHLTVTEVAEMGQYTFGNLEGWEGFATRAKPGDIVVVGSNFGAGSSRQQAVDCFKSLGVQAIVAQSFGAIYERNAINTGFPILIADAVRGELADGDEITVDLVAGTVTLPSGTVVEGSPCAEVQLEIYRRGGLLS